MSVDSTRPSVVAMMTRLFPPVASEVAVPCWGIAGRCGQLSPPFVHVDPKVTFVYQGKTIELPVIGPIARQQAGQ